MNSENKGSDDKNNVQIFPGIIRERIMETVGLAQA